MKIKSNVEKEVLETPGKVAESVTEFVAAAAYEGLHDRVIDIKQATIRVAELYLELCRFIRVNQIPPALVSQEMRQQGFIKERISEVNRIAQVSDEAWSEYEARRIGYRTVLQIARKGTSEDVEIIDCSSNSTPDNSPLGESAQGIEPEKGQEKGQTEDGKTNLSKDKLKIDTCKRFATGILKIAEFFNWRHKIWNNNTGWSLELRPPTKTKKKLNKPAPQA